jgi:TPR repeat protein
VAKQGMGSHHVVLITALSCVACACHETRRDAAGASADAASATGPAAAQLQPAKQPAANPGDPACAGLGCYDMSIAAERDGQLARAAELLAFACDQELAQACHRLGTFYRDGRGVKVDEARSRVLFERACSQGSVSACNEFGH